jgi:phage tail-like protein
MSETGLGIRFTVTIDGQGSLGDWTKCEGLTVEYDIHEYKEGGQNGFIHRLPGRAKYQNIKLTRPVTKISADVASWVSGVQATLDRTTATIAVLDATGEEVASWTLDGVFPARWTGPSLDVGGNQVAIEVLELAHNGFMPA